MQIKTARNEKKGAQCDIIRYWVEVWTVDSSQSLLIEESSLHLAIFVNSSRSMLTVHCVAFTRNSRD